MILILIVITGLLILKRQQLINEDLIPTLGSDQIIFVNHYKNNTLGMKSSICDICGDWEDYCNC